MAKRTGDAPAALSANDLRSGRVLWWTGTRWSGDFAEAAEGKTPAARAELWDVAVREEAANAVVGAVLVPLDGHRPAGLREGRRLSGPSIPLPGAR